VPVPQLVNYRYSVVQLRSTRSLLHKNNTRELHACTSNEKFIVFSPSDYSVSILTSSPLLSCHFGSTATTEIWRPIDFSRWLPRPLSTTSGFVFVDVLAFRSKFVNKPNFVDLNGHHVSIYGWDITTSGLEKQTSTILEFYFRFRSRPFSLNLHFILHQPAEFHPNIALSRWRPRRLNTTSAFVSVDVTVFRRLKFISKPIFVEISQMAAEI